MFDYKETHLYHTFTVVELWCWDLSTRTNHSCLLLQSIFSVLIFQLYVKKQPQVVCVFMFPVLPLQQYQWTSRTSPLQGNKPTKFNREFPPKWRELPEGSSDSFIMFCSVKLRDSNLLTATRTDIFSHWSGGHKAARPSPVFMFL